MVTNFVLSFSPKTLSKHSVSSNNISRFYNIKDIIEIVIIQNITIATESNNLLFEQSIINKKFNGK